MSSGYAQGALPVGVLGGQSLAWGKARRILARVTSQGCSMCGSMRRQRHRLYFGIVKPSNTAIPAQRMVGILVPAPCLIWSGRRGKERPGFTPMVGAIARGGTRTCFSSHPSHVDAFVLQHRVSPSTH